MRIGNRVIVKNCKNFNFFNGQTGTIIREQICMSQAAFLMGCAKWVVEFDTPVEVLNPNDPKNKCYVTSDSFWETELELI